MCLSKELVKKIDAVPAAAIGRNRNEVLTISLEFALNHTEIMIKEQAEI